VPSSYALGQHFERFVREQIESGRYQSASEVVRDGLRLLEERAAWQQAKLDALRAEIQKGIDSGPGRPLDDVVAELKGRYQKWAADGPPADAL
jgi:antitoxin ParD1/3/4